MQTTGNKKNLFPYGALVFISGVLAAALFYLSADVGGLPSGMQLAGILLSFFAVILGGIADKIDTE